MRVLMFGHDFQPCISGGIGTACYGIAKGISQFDDIDFLFIAPRDKINFPNVLEQLSKFNNIAESIADREPHDIIYANDWTSYLAGSAAKKVSGKPLFINIHNSEDDFAGNSASRTLLEIERIGIQSADKVIVVNNSTSLNVMENHSIMAEKVVVIYDTNVSANSFELKLVRKELTKGKFTAFRGKITINNDFEILQQSSNLISHKKLHYSVAI